MIPASASLPSSRKSFALRAASLAAVLVTLDHAARAQGAPAPATVADRSGFLSLFMRLDAMALLLIVAAVAILALLIWRVIVMVRGEKPAVVPPPRRTRTGDDADALDRPSLQRTTDWGFDQNKRAALARSPVAVSGGSVDLPSIDHAVTMWSTTDVQNAHRSGVQPADAMGQSPVVAASPYRTSFNPYFKAEQPANRIEVVEVADTLLQAELLVQLGDPKQAMTLLSHHIRDTEKPGPAAWLMLLNLYQSTGREAQYNTLSSGFRTLFNAEVPPWATSPDVAARELEAYPQVMMKLQTAWSGPQARPTVDGMLNDDRGGSRQGFSLTAYRELLFLSDLLDTIATIAREDDERTGIQRKLGTLPA